MRGLNLSQFSKVKSDAKSTTLKHPKGHEITIAHNGITKDMRKELDSLPIKKMADGGGVSASPTPKDDIYMGSKKDQADEVKGATEGTTSADLKSGWQNVKSTLGFAKGGEVAHLSAGGSPTGSSVPDDDTLSSNVDTSASTPVSEDAPQAVAAAPTPSAPLAGPGGVPDDDDAIAPAQDPTPASPQAAGAAVDQSNQAPDDPFGTGATQQAFIQGLGQQMTGIKGEAAAKGDLGNAESDILAKQVQTQQENVKNYQEHYNELDNERQAFQQDIQNSHIDPKHYLNSLGTGQKISNAIGMILGGFGAVAGQPSAAGEFINQQITRDIEAQKMELGKKENLLSANMRQFGNLKDATDMTRVMQNDVVINQLRKAAANAASPLAKSAALEQIGKLNSDSAAQIGQMSMRRTLMSGMAAGRVDPSRVVNLLVPENQRSGANKELTDATNTSAMRDNLMNAFDHLAKMNTVGNAITSPFQTPKEVAAIKAPLLAAMSKGTAGRFTEADAKMLEPLFPAKGDSAETQAIKRNQLSRLASEKMQPNSFPILNTYGVDVNKLGTYNGQGQSKITESPRTKGK